MKRVYLIAVVFALIAGFATYMFASEIDKKTTLKDEETVNVAVALQDIPANTEITEEMFAEDAGYFGQKSIVIDYLVPNYVEYAKANELIGTVSDTDIYSGEQLNSKHFLSKDSDKVSLSYKLADGKVAYSFNAQTVNGVDGYISEGDTVDVLTYTKDENDKTETKVAYKDLKIIRVSSNSDNADASTNGSKITSYSTLTVEVTEKQALKLYEIENNYSYKLILNAKE